MMFQKTFLAAAFTLFAHALPAPETEGALAGYTIVEGVNWIGPVTRNGPNVSLNGTVESIYGQIIRLNPDFDSLNLGSAPVRRDSDMSPLARRGVSAWPPTCGAFSGNEDWAESSIIRDGIEYLKRIGGTLHLSPGIGLCSRVSCSYNSAIFLCHDRNEDLYTPTLWVAEYAGGIADYCHFKSRAHPDIGYVSGQLFDINRTWMNIIVARPRNVYPGTKC